MPATKEVKKKINSVQSTKKITSAMELVAASKMRRTQVLMRASRPYAEKIREVIGHLAGASPEYRNEYMQVREVRRVGYLVVSTDRGLCGGLNVNMLRLLVRDMQQWRDQQVESELALIGNKAVAFFRAFGGQVVAAYTNYGEKPAIRDLVGGISVMLNAYASGRIDRLMIISNEYVSTMVQRPVLRQLLPLEQTLREAPDRRWDYLYEPEARDLVEGLVTRFIESQVYQAVIENIACEQAAKMIAMKNATQNADEMLEELTLLYNNARQAAITQEIAEIVGGADAV